MKIARAAAYGGIIGPSAFIAAWATSAALTDADYSGIDDAISRLAAVDADTRPLMTAGFVLFGVGVPLYATGLRRVVEGPAWMTAFATGIATLGVAATPLDHSATVDDLHAVFASLGYVTLAATPLLAARPLAAAGHSALARFGVLAGALSGLSLVLSSTSLPTGLFQRLGLSVVDAWIIASALAMLRGELHE